MLHPVPSFAAIFWYNWAHSALIKVDLHENDSETLIDRDAIQEEMTRFLLLKMAIICLLLVANISSHLLTQACLEFKVLYKLQ